MFTSDIIKMIEIIEKHFGSICIDNFSTTILGQVVLTSSGGYKFGYENDSVICLTPDGERKILN